MLAIQDEPSVTPYPHKKRPQHMGPKDIFIIALNLLFFLSWFCYGFLLSFLELTGRYCA